MALPYKVWTEEDIKNRNVSEVGDYPFTILSVTKKRTKQKLDNHGQPLPTYEMWEMELEFHDKNGVIKKIKEWIVFCDGMDWKLRHLAKTTGLLELYESQTLDAHHLVSKHGIFSLGIKEYEKDREMLKMNFIKDYVKKSAPLSHHQDNSLDSDIPNM